MTTDESTKKRRPRFQFSIGVLLALVAVCAVALQRATVPRQTARRFAQAVNQGEYSEAEALCLDRSRGLLNRWLKESDDQQKVVAAKVSTWGGRRNIYVGIKKTDGSWDPSRSLECFATYNGIEIRMAVP